MVLIIDNYDSFTYNLVQYIGECGAQPQVFRNDQIDIPEIAELSPDAIVLSPGPCTPKQAGICQNISTEVQNPKSQIYGTPVLGVCLGHQTLGMMSGAEIVSAKQIKHGKTSSITHDERGIFKGIPSPILVIRYHSLVIDPCQIPKNFVVSARAKDDDSIMAIRHQNLPIEGVQFHPESVLTEYGMVMIQNFLSFDPVTSSTFSLG